MADKRQNPSPRARRVLRGFTKWRRQRRGREAIPSQLWREAAELAGTEGVCRTAQLLRLDYKDLKFRMNRVGESAPPKAVFTEYRLSGDGAGLSCRIEVEGRSVGVLALEFSGQSPQALAGFIRCLAGWV